jgi:hypothetical protein
MTNETAEMEKERKIITNAVYESKDEVEGVLDKLLEKQEEADAKTNAISEIMDYFLRILYKINRFSEFKSKFRVLKRGDTISKKELERCKFVVKIRQNKEELSVLKNDITATTGIFKHSGKKSG